MKLERLKERVELLAVGEAIGFPRLAYGRSTKIPHDKRIPAGKAQWEKFCAHAHTTRIPPALRIAKVLHENRTPMPPMVAALELIADLDADFDDAPKKRRPVPSRN